ncbi:MAG TPA: DUF2806 domain-containing protein [Rhodanobacteraceae bacterium]
MDFPGEKLVIKLWETVAERGLGGMFKPWQMRREGRVTNELKREELLTIAQAEQDAAKIRCGEATFLPANAARLALPGTSNPEVLAGNRDVTEALSVAAIDSAVSATVRRDANVTRALLHAEESLEQDPQEPPKANVNEDWLFRWRDSAGDVSSEELQDLWGRVLAGELKSPGSYSLRTLEFLRCISQEEAQAISKVSRFVIGNAIYRDNDLLEAKGIPFGMLLYMQQIGVMAGVEAVGLTLTLKSNISDKYQSLMKCNSKVLVITGDNPDLEITLPVYQLTAIGQQVAKLGSFEPDIEYLEKIGEKFKEQKASVLLADYIDISASQIRYFNSRQL